MHRCPECGRIFDAGDPQTYTTDTTEEWSFTWYEVFLISVGATSPFWIYALYLWFTGNL